MTHMYLQAPKITFTDFLPLSPTLSPISPNNLTSKTTLPYSRTRNAIPLAYQAYPLPINLIPYVHSHFAQQPHLHIPKPTPPADAYPAPIINTQFTLAAIFNGDKYLRAVLTLIPNFRFDYHGTVIKGWSDSNRNVVYETLNNRQPMEKTEFDAKWDALETVEVDHEALVFLIDELPERQDGKQRDGIVTTLQGMNIRNKPAFIQWCSLYMKDIGFWYSLRKEEWMFQESRWEGWAIEQTIHNMISQIQTSGCNDAIALSEHLHNWLDNGLPRSFLVACNDEDWDMETFPAISPVKDHNRKDGADMDEDDEDEEDEA
ncbi:hypothetical protein HDV00_000996 [Rhizophlyctis rosea]|nr:hypothetical protein HDV00_000996 [Rhizophlyctis rosea]